MRTLFLVFLSHPVWKQDMQQDQNPPCYRAHKAPVVLGDKKNNRVILAILLAGDHQEKLREISFLPDLHCQVKSAVSSGKFNRIVTIFPDYQLFWRLEGIGPANTIF